MTNFWWVKADNSLRHDSFTYSDDEDNHTCKDCLNNPRLKGTVEWLQFIWNMAQYTKVFTENVDFNLELGPKAIRIPELHDEIIYCEDYGPFRVYLDNPGGVAYIECDDPELIPFAQKAWQEVQDRYGN